MNNVSTIFFPCLVKVKKYNLFSLKIFLQNFTTVSPNKLNGVNYLSHSNAHEFVTRRLIGKRQKFATVYLSEIV